MTAKKDTIKYAVEHEWSGYTLEQREDGLWVYEQWSKVQGCRSRRRVVLRAPADITIEDEDDLDTAINNYGLTKAEYVLHHAREIRCLRRGHIVQ